MPLKKYRLQIVLALLVLIFTAVLPRSKDSFKDSFIPKDSDAVMVTLSHSKEGTLVLKKLPSFWLGEFISLHDEKIYFPCDPLAVQKFLDNAQKPLTVYEISDTDISQQEYSLSQDDAFFVEFAVKTRKKRQKVSKIRFGSIDHFGAVSFCREGKAKIYSVKSEIFNFLKTDISFWGSPELFPASVCGSEKNFLKENAASFLKFRHGGLLSEASGRFDWSGAEPLELFSGSGDSYRIEFIQDEKSPGDFLCRLKAVPSLVREEEERAAIKKFNYVMKVSSWTFGKIFTEKE